MHRCEASGTWRRRHIITYNWIIVNYSFSIINSHVVRHSRMFQHIAGEPSAKTLVHRHEPERNTRAVHGTFSLIHEFIPRTLSVSRRGSGNWYPRVVRRSTKCVGGRSGNWYPRVVRRSTKCVGGRSGNWYPRVAPRSGAKWGHNELCITHRGQSGA